jgi:hypothetical protein
MAPCGLLTVAASAKTVAGTAVAHSTPAMAADSHNLVVLMVSILIWKFHSRMQPNDDRPRNSLVFAYSLSIDLGHEKVKSFDWIVSIAFINSLTASTARGG